MSYNYCACHGLVIPMDEAMEKLGYKEVWEMLKKEEGDVLDSLVDYSSFGRDEKDLPDDEILTSACLTIIKAIDQIIPPDKYNIFRPSGDLIQCGEVVEEGAYYIEVWFEAVYDMTPLPTMKQLTDLGLTPQIDSWVTGG